MSKVAGKRYTYKFDFNGLIHACQQMTATSAETLAISSAVASPPTSATSLPVVSQQLPYTHPAETSHQFGKSIHSIVTSFHLILL